LDISIGSLSEISYALLLAKDLRILTAEDGEKLAALHTAAGKLIWGLYRSARVRGRSHS